MKALSWLGAACLLAGLIVPCTAAAQGKAAAPKKGAAPKAGTPAAAKEETPKEKAAPYIKGGARAAAAGDWDDAYAEYSIAWSIEHTWEIAAGLGKSAYKSKHYAESIQRLGYYLREAPSGRVSAKERNEVEGWIRDARSRTGLIVITGPAGGEVIVDGEVAGTTPLAEAVSVDVGKHKIEVRRGSGGETKTAEITAGAKVELDFTPAQALPPKTVVVKEEGVFTPQVRSAAVIGGGALALSGIVAGGVLLGVSFAKADEKQQAKLDPFGFGAATAAARAEADMKSAAIWCFVGGGLAAAGTGVFYLVTRPRLQAPVKAGAFVGPGGPSVWVQGQF